MSMFIIDEQYDNNDMYEEYLLWLKNNTKPWSKVTEYWISTSKKRVRDFINSQQPCYEYMSQFPAFTDPLGYLLVSIWSIILINPLKNSTCITCLCLFQNIFPLQIVHIYFKYENFILR